MNTANRTDDTNLVMRKRPFASDDTNLVMRNLTTRTVAVTLLLLLFIATWNLRPLMLTQTKHSVPVPGKHTSHSDFFDLETFIETFEAARPEWTERCKAYG
jgi:hypothetical protein